MSRQKKVNLEMGKRIKQLRGSRLQSYMAGMAGITQGMWSKCEDGNLPDIDILFRISKALETNIEYLWDGTNVLNLVSEPRPAYLPELNDSELIKINKSWPDLCDHQKSAVISVIDAFSKQDTNSLETKENRA